MSGTPGEPWARSFALLDVGDSIAMATAVVADLQPRRVIVSDPAARSHALLGAERFIAYCEHAAREEGARTLRDVSAIATPARSIERSRVFEALHDGPAVVLDRGMVIGYIDPTDDQEPHRSDAAARPVSSISAPDLTILVTEARDDRTFLLRVTARDPALDLSYKPFGPVRIAADPQTFFSEWFDKVQRLKRGSAAERLRSEQELRLKGCALTDQILPPGLRDLLWSLRTKVESVQFLSEEPWVPWELCALHDAQGDSDEQPFLCEAFRVTRWLLGSASASDFTLGLVGILCPSTTDPPEGIVEYDELCDILGDGGAKVETIGPGFRDIVMALGAGGYDGIHFIGHGVAHPTDPNLAQLSLCDGEVLRPEIISGVVQRGISRRRPLVFLNACETGVAGVSLTRAGGWARQFIEARAGAFIGTWWPVPDRVAAEFARLFYEALRDGLTLAEAASKARVDCAPAGDPARFAYVVFGNPMATQRR